MCTLAAIAVLALASVASEPDPLVGKWEGSWEYATFMQGHVGTFRMVISGNSSRLKGRFTSLDYKVIHGERKSANSDEMVFIANVRRINRTSSVRKITRLAGEPPYYRWEADGFCRNVTLDGNTISGLINGGPCAPSGIGSGARLIQVSAKRVPATQQKSPAVH